MYCVLLSMKITSFDMFLVQVVIFRTSPCVCSAVLSVEKAELLLFHCLGFLWLLVVLWCGGFLFLFFYLFFFFYSSSSCCVLQCRWQNSTQVLARELKPLLIGQIISVVYRLEAQLQIGMTDLLQMKVKELILQKLRELPPDLFYCDNKKGKN